MSDLPYPCEKCDYSFETSEQLEEHELKHAEMEYEEQIEKEVINEALQKGDVQKSPDEITDKEGTSVMEYSIEDFSNPELSIVPRQKNSINKGTHIQKQTEASRSHEVLAHLPSRRLEYIEETESQQQSRLNKSTVTDQQVHAGNYVPFLKDEVDSDVEEMGIAPEVHQQGTFIYYFYMICRLHRNLLNLPWSIFNFLLIFAEEPEETSREEIEPIKPIVRHEGTKVYYRKPPTERKIPEILPEPIRMSSLEEPPQLQDRSTLRVRDLSPKTLSSLQTKKVVDMKMGNKMVKVQKFIITKEEMKAMAKQGKHVQL